MTDEGIPGLIESESYQRLLRQLADAAGIGIVPEYGHVLQGIDQRTVQTAGVPLSALSSLLVSDHAALLRYSVEKLRRYRDDDDEEYPPGEEPDPDDEPRPQIVGLSKGAVLDHAVEYWLLKNAPDRLLEYVRKRRFPHAAAYARELKAIFAQATAT